MCNYCKELIECPIGEKRTSVIMQGESNFKTEMVLDRYAVHIESFIHSEFIDKEGYWHNMSVHITHCPFCGTKLNGRS